MPNGENYNIEPIIDILTLFKIQQVERGSLSRIKCDGDVSCDFVKERLAQFGAMISIYTSREQQKKLLHMLLTKITISKTSAIESIELK